MKIWLSDILACPICKHYPLELLILKWETESNEIQDFITIFQNRDMNIIEKEEIVKSIEKEKELKIRDGIVLKYTSFFDYLKTIKSSVQELDNVKNLTNEEPIKKALDIIKSEIFEKIDSTLKESEGEKSLEKLKESFKDIIPELNFVNKIKIDTEIEEGVLFCSKCNRWYPIIDTIPQMLPDKYRHKNEEIKFLKNWQPILEKIDFFINKLVPFNI